MPISEAMGVSSLTLIGIVMLNVLAFSTDRQTYAYYFFNFF